MEGFSEERYTCPECSGKTNVIWDPGQESRDVDCIHCRHDVTDMVPVMEEDGSPKMALDKAGNPFQVMEPNHYKVGCRYTIERGKGEV